MCVNECKLYVYDRNQRRDNLLCRRSSPTAVATRGVPPPRLAAYCIAHMIDYRRTSWYGLGYLFPPWRRGSVLPRCMPAAIAAGVFNGLIAADYIDLAGSDVKTGDYLSHPYTFQLVGIVFGYLMVTRINMSYARYWEG